MAATLDDVLAAIRASSASIINTAETARRLNIGENHLAELVQQGLIKRVPHLRGKGNGHCYHVDEVRACADRLQADRALRAVG